MVNNSGRKRDRSSDGGLSSSKRQQTPSGSGREQSPGKNVRFDPSLQAGPSGTGQSDTRRRSPEKSNMSGSAMDLLKRPDERFAVVPEPNELRQKGFQRDFEKYRTLFQDLGVSRLDAPKAVQKFKKEWTRYVEDMYGSKEMMTLEGPVPIINEPRPDLVQKFSANKPNHDNGKDAEMAKGIYEIVQMIRDFAKAFTTSKIQNPEKFLNILLGKENEQLIRYIGCSSIAGNKGRESWDALVKKTSSREAIVMAVIGRALKEHVFSSLWFGGTQEQIEAMNSIDQDSDNTDGFLRTQLRAEQAKAFINSKGTREKDAFKRASIKVKIQLQRMLTPFYNGGERLPKPQEPELQKIVAKAAELSRYMRCAPDVVYYWPPTFKDEEFEPDRMECLNLEEMIKNSPYEKKVIDSVVRSVLSEPKENKDRSEAIVRVVCFPGIVAYRRGGGDTGRKQLAEEKLQPDLRPPDVRRRARMVDGSPEKYTGDEGHRGKTICKAVVFLDWSKSRLLTKEAGTSQHIDAVRDGKMDRYVQDYKDFVELYDLAKKQWESETGAGFRAMDPLAGRR